MLSEVEAGAEERRRVISGLEIRTPAVSRSRSTQEELESA